MRPVQQSNLSEEAIFATLTLCMKKLLSFAALCLLAASCSNQPKQTDSMVDAKVDSIVGTRMEDINSRAMEDLDRRMSIEVKAKADSIIAARRTGAAGRTGAAADTMRTSPQPLP
jgi:hypothetical protein